MKRKIVATILLLCVVFSTLMMSGCSKSDGSSSKDGKEQGDLLARIKERGELIIGTEGTWAPWTYHDEDDKLVGFDIEVAQKIAEKLGVKAKFMEAKWDSLFAGIDAQRYDIIANGVEITDERSQKYDFTDAYGYIHTAIIVKKDNDSIKSFEDLKGKKTANTLSSTYAELAESYGAETVGVDSLDQTMDLVLADRVDATLNADVSYYDYVKIHSDAPLKIAALTKDASIVSIPVKKGEDSASFIKAVNDAIKELQESGELSEIAIKYFGNDISKKDSNN